MTTKLIHRNGIFACDVMLGICGGLADSGKKRVGTCDDASSQMEYFCNPDNAANDSIVAIDTGLQ